MVDEGPASEVAVAGGAEAGDPPRLPRRRGHFVPRGKPADRTYRGRPRVRSRRSLAWDRHPIWRPLKLLPRVRLDWEYGAVAKLAEGLARFLSMGWDLEDFQCAGSVRIREVGASW